MEKQVTYSNFQLFDIEGNELPLSNKLEKWAIEYEENWKQWNEMNDSQRIEFLQSGKALLHQAQSCVLSQSDELRKACMEFLENFYQEEGSLETFKILFGSNTEKLTDEEWKLLSFEEKERAVRSLRITGMQLVDAEIDRRTNITAAHELNSTASNLFEVLRRIKENVRNANGEQLNHIREQVREVMAAKSERTVTDFYKNQYEEANASILRDITEFGREIGVTADLAAFITHHGDTRSYNFSVFSEVPEILNLIKTVPFLAKFSETEKLINIRDKLRDEVNRRKQTPQKKEKKRESSHLPYIVPVNTSREIKTSLQAVADGKTLRNWEPVQGEIALRHAIPGEEFETKLTTADGNGTYESLKCLLKEWGGLECALQFQFVFEAVLLHERAYLDLDDLIRELRWNVHSVEERQEMRERVFNRLNLFSQIASYGERSELYTDSLTKEKNKIFSRGPFIRLLDHYFTEQQIKNKETVPIGVTAVAGDWANQHRGNRQILHAIGNARRLAGLSTGQASGEWALSIGLTLLQYWRQAANKHSRVERVGENKELTIIFDKPFTRFQLLDLFPPSKFPVAEMLQSKNPGRARTTWDKAITLLKKQGVISYYAQLNKKELPPQRWQNTWLKDETFDIRPATEAKNDAIEINQSGTKLRAAWAKKNGSKKNVTKSAKN